MKSNSKNKILIMLLIMVLLVVVACKKEEQLSNVHVVVNDTELKPLTAKVSLLKKEEIMQTKEDSVINFTNLPIGKYKLKIIKEGYQEVKENLIVKEEDVKKKITLKKNKQEEPKQQLQPGDLYVVTNDTNDNPLAAKVVLLQEGKVIKSRTGSNLKFYDLSPGKYRLNVSKKGYQPIENNVIIKGEGIKTSIQLSGGHIKHKIVNLKEEQVINIEGLKSNEEVIIGLTPLDMATEDSLGAKFNLNAIYYNYFGKRVDRQIADSISKEFKVNSQSGLEAKLRAREQELVVKGEAINKEQSDKQYSFYGQEEFHVPDLISAIDKKNSAVTAKMVGAGKHIYIFVDNRVDLPLDKINDLAREFDTNIYPTLTTKFGQPSDVDNNGKIVVLLTKFNNYKTSGLFYSEDLKQGVPGTNFNDIVYLNVDKGTGRNLYPALAHQFQHLIFYNSKLTAQRKADDIWINEGLAKLAEKLCGYIDYGKEAWSWHGGNNWVYSDSVDYPGYFMMTENISIVDDNLSIPYLGGVSLFMDYLYEQYGVELVSNLVSSSDGPYEVIESYTGVSFEKLFLNWITTNVTDRITTIDNKSYNYQSFDLAIGPRMLKIDDDYNSSVQIKKTGVQYLKLYGQNSDIQLSLNGTVANKIGIVIIRREN